MWRGRVRRAIASTDAVITVSEWSADDVSEVFGVDRDTIRVIKHGIDVETFSTPTELSSEVAARISEDFVLYLGNIEPRKNLMPLVRAFQQEPLRSAGLQLVIAGKPAWNFAESMAEIQAAPNVVHLGFVSDADRVALMQRTALFAFPSLYEGFGFPVLEAMAAGAPVATSRRGSLVEVAGPAWVLKDLTAPGAESLAACLADEGWRAGVTDVGHAWARQFTWDVSIDEHVRVFESVLC